MAIFTLASVLCGLAVNAPMLVAARMLQGIGAAMMMPVGRWPSSAPSPSPSCCAAMNFVIIPALIGPLLGPTVGGLIVHWLSWRDIFFVNVPVGLVALWSRRTATCPTTAATRRGRSTCVGLVLFGCGRGAAVVAARDLRRAQARRDVRRSVLLLLVARRCSAAYGWHARRVPYPLLRLSLFSIRTFRVSVVGGFVTRLGIGGMPFLLPLLYQLGLGLPAWQSGLLMMPAAAAAMGMKFISARDPAPLRLPAGADRQHAC